MTIPMTPAQVLAREFLEIRAKILELAASFDRLDRAAAANETGIESDARLAQIQAALAQLKPNMLARAEQVQIIFSRRYEATWPQAMGIEVTK